jgi:hypothetical protein
MDPEETLRLAVELTSELADAMPASPDDGDPICEWCGAVVPDGDSAYAPYCSE